MDGMMQGSAQGEIPGASETQPRRKLYRSITDRRIAGVCGGVAAYIGVDSLLVRILWVASCFVGFIGGFAYIAAWIIIPEAPSGEPVRRTAAKDSTNLSYLWGIILIVLGVVLLADRQGVDFLVPWHWPYYMPHWVNLGVLFSLLIIIGGIALIVRHPAQAGSTSPEVTPAATLTEQTQESKPRAPKRLTRSLDERMIGGVCGGLAKYFNIDPSFVRIGWVLLTISGMVFLGVVAYIVMMIVVPEETQIESSSSQG